MQARVQIILIGIRPILADAISLVLRVEGSIDVLGSVTDPEDLPVRALSSVDVLIFDARTKGFSGSTIRWWKHRCPRSRAIAVDVDDDSAALDWIAGGLDGFVGAGAHIGELFDTLRLAIRGEVNAPAALLARVMHRIRTLSASRNSKGVHLALTLRETEILYLLAEGLSNKEIAARLDISLYTVKNHVHNMLEKMSVRHRRQAIRRALDNGILRPGSSALETAFSGRPLELR
jgi:DNA-binding NarL/FixJ family response regulator